MVRSKRAILFLLPLALTFAIPACSTDGSSSGSSSGGTSSAKVAAKQHEAANSYDDAIDELGAAYEKCVNDLNDTGECTVDDPSTGHVLTLKLGKLDVQGIGDFRRARQLLGQVRQLLSDAKGKMCETLAPFAGLGHPYFYYGGSVQGGAGGVAQIGADVVYDIWNQQAAVFSYRGVGAESLAGAEAGAYMGYGFGNKSSVLDAWSGRFCTGSVSVGLKGVPLAGIGAFGSAFISPDATVVGGAVGVSGYLGWSPPVGGSAVAADWGAWNSATSALNNVGWGYRSDVVQNADGQGHDLIQYRSSFDMAMHVLWNLPPPQNVAVATQVLAVAALRRTGLTLDQACPNEVAAARPPEILRRVGDACGAIPNPLAPSDGADGGASGPSKTDCGDKSDGWWCLDLAEGAPWMAYCEGHQIVGGCGCASCTTAGVHASCSASPPPAACP